MQRLQRATDNRGPRSGIIIFGVCVCLSCIAWWVYGLSDAAIGGYFVHDHVTGTGESTLKASSIPVGATEV